MPYAGIAPGDNVTLAVALQPDGSGAETTRIVKCYVYDPDGNANSSNPFALTHKANGYYELNNAYSASARGFYKHLYKIFNSYTSEVVNVESGIFPRVFETIVVKTEPAFGQSMVDAVIANQEEVENNIALKVWRFVISRVKTPGSAAQVLLNKPDEIPASITQTMDVSELKNLTKDFTSNLVEIQRLLMSIDKKGLAVDNDKISESIAGKFRNLLLSFSKEMKDFNVDIVNQLNSKDAERLLYVLESLKKIFVKK